MSTLYTRLRAAFFACLLLILTPATASIAAEVPGERPEGTGGLDSFLARLGQDGARERSLAREGCRNAL